MNDTTFIKKKSDNRKLTVEDFFFLKVGAMWRYFKSEHPSFWFICAYLFFEYTRPQAIFPVIDFMPWAQLLLMASLGFAFLDKSVQWVSSPINKLMIIFGLLIYLSSLHAYDSSVSQQYFINFYGWLVIYFLIITIVNTKERLYIFTLIFVFSAAKIAVGTTLVWASRGFVFATWGLEGPEGYFKNSGELTILMLTLFPVVFFLLTRVDIKIKWTEKAIIALFSACAALTILGASSRGSQLALAIILLFMFRKQVLRIKPIIGLAIIVFAAYKFLPQEQVARFQSAGEDETSIQRLLYWKNGMKMIQDHPLTGVGFYNFPSYYNNHYSHDLVGRNRAQLPHNILIQVGTDMGYPGLIVFMGFFWFAFRKNPKIENPTPSEQVVLQINWAILYGAAGFFIAGQFVTVAYYPFLWIALAFNIAIKNIFVRKAKQQRKDPFAAPLEAKNDG